MSPHHTASHLYQYVSSSHCQSPLSVCLLITLPVTSISMSPHHTASHLYQYVSSSHCQSPLSVCLITPPVTSISMSPHHTASHLYQYVSSSHCQSPLSVCLLITLPVTSISMSPHHTASHLSAIFTSKTLFYGRLQSTHLHTSELVQCRNQYETGLFDGTACIAASVSRDCCCCLFHLGHTVNKIYIRGDPHSQQDLHQR